MTRDARDPERWRRLRRRLRRPVRFGTLRRTSPISDHWGRDRGTPIDRWYIDRFLGANQADVRGRALEVRDAGYLTRFGGAVSSIDILDVDPANPQATIVADLSAPGALPDARFDVIVLTQVLQYVADVPVAIATLHAALAPGGTLLLTVPGISRIGRSDLEVDLWRFTPAGMARLLHATFDPADVEVAGHGNVLAATAFVAGVAAEELQERELEVHDPAFPVVVTVRAVRR